MRAPLLVLLLAVGCDNIKPPASRDTDVADDTGRPGACLELSAESVDFGVLAFNAFESADLTLSNPCSEELVITSLAVDLPVQVSPGNLPLQPGGFAVVTLFVQPDAYGTFTKDLTLTTDEAGVGTDGVVIVPVTFSVEADADGDGYDTTAAEGGTDCDDTDADINPGAEEEWYNGIDEDCDGGNDWDRDGDGYEVETDAHHPAEPDCNDLNVDFHPGAEDAPYDNRDTNCDDENDYDADGDGYESDDYGRGSDCDDFDASVNREGLEALNGKDDNCDGETDVDAYATYSPYAYDADGNWDRTGYSIAIGDLDADGSAELIVGSPYFDATSGGGTGRGGVSVFEGPDLLPTLTEIDRADNFIEGNALTDLLGTYVAVVGDYDGDGIDDLAMGAIGVTTGGTGGGAVYLLGGYDARRGDLGDAMVTFTGTTSASFGRGIGSNIDLDGDGLAEVVIAYASGSYNGVAVQYGDVAPSGTVSLSAMDAKWTTDGTEMAFYRNAPVGGDLDGDGRDDLLVSDGMADYGYTDSGAAWVIWGQGTQYAVPTATDLDSAATVVVRGDASSDYDAWTTQIGDDVDGDGDAELWVYNQDEAIYLVPGGASLRSPVTPSTAATATFTWDTSDPDAEQLRRAGDWDGDGIEDMFVFYEDASGAYGRVEVLPSGLRGRYTMADAIIGQLSGSSEDDGDNGNVGFGMAPLPGDLDGDGDLDMAVGDPEFDSGHGRAYVLLNGSTAAGE